MKITMPFKNSISINKSITNAYEETQSSLKQKSKAISLIKQMNKVKKSINDFNIMAHSRNKSSIENDQHYNFLKSHLYLTVNSGHNNCLSPSNSSENGLYTLSNSIISLKNQLKNERNSSPTLNNYFHNNKPSKFALNLGTLYNNQPHCITDFTQSTKLIVKLKEVIRLKQIESNTIQEEMIEKRNKLLKNYSSYENMAKELQNPTNNTAKNYVLFLYHNIDEQREEMNKLAILKIKLKSEVYDLRALVINKTQKREMYHSMRNFLVCVKEHTLSLPSLFTTIDDIRIKMKRNPLSPRKNIFYNKPRRQSQLKNSPLKNSENIPSVKFIAKERTESPKGILQYLNPTKPIFLTVEEFNDSLRDLELRNIDLVNILDRIREEIHALQLQKIENQNEQKKNDKEVKCYEKEIEQDYIYLRKKNQMLQNRRDSLETTIVRFKPMITSIKKDLSDGIDVSLMKYQQFIQRTNYKTEQAYMFIYLSTIVMNILNANPTNYYSDIFIKAKMLQCPDDNNPITLRKISMEFVQFIEYELNIILKKLNKYDKTKSYYIKTEENIIVTKKQIKSFEQRQFMKQINDEHMLQTIAKHKKIYIRKRLVSLDNTIIKGRNEKIEKKSRNKPSILTLRDVIEYSGEDLDIGISQNVRKMNVGQMYHFSY